MIVSSAQSARLSLDLHDIQVEVTQVRGNTGARSLPLRRELVLALVLMVYRVWLLSCFWRQRHYNDVSLTSLVCTSTSELKTHCSHRSASFFLRVKP